MTAELDHRVRAKVTQHLADNLLAGAVVTVLVAAFLTFALFRDWLPAPAFGVAPYLYWTLATFLVVALRHVLRKRQRTSSTVPAHVERNLRNFRVGAALAGICWGGLGVLGAFSPSETHLIALLIVAAMVMGAIPYLAADPLSYLLFLSGCVVPVIAGELLAASDYSLIIAPLAVVFGLGMYSSARTYARLLQSSLELRIASDRLTSRIADANRRLESELEHRKEVARQLQQARNSAEAANRAKTVFLSRMSHELRTPLNAVLGFSELLSIMPLHELAEKKTEYLQKINSSGGHLLSLIEDILDITRIDNGQLTLTEQTFPVLALLQECATMLETKAAEFDVTIVVDADDDKGMTISTDRLRLRQVLLNLMSNAVKYNRPGGRVDVSFRGLSDSIRIEVRDTGIGIAAEDIDKAFEPFARLRNENGSVEGTGIGLTITRQLTEMMQGTIQLRSEVNVGTSVVVDLPRVLDESRQLQPTGT